MLCYTNATCLLSRNFITGLPQLKSCAFILAPEMKEMGRFDAYVPIDRLHALAHAETVADRAIGAALFAEKNALDDFGGGTLGDVIVT
jgi:hypothetical protein